LDKSKNSCENGETVSPSPEIIILGEGNRCPLQLVQVAPVAFGIQGHLELTENLLRRWLKEDPDLRYLDPHTIWNDYQDFYPLFKQAGERLFYNFIKLVYAYG